MRGIPRRAVAANTPLIGSPLRAADIADETNACEWNPDMVGIDHAVPGAHAYYDSVLALYADWGVDFLKVDDMLWLPRPPRSRPWPSTAAAGLCLRACPRAASSR